MRNAENYVASLLILIKYQLQNIFYKYKYVYLFKYHLSSDYQKNKHKLWFTIINNKNKIYIVINNKTDYFLNIAKMKKITHHKTVII